MNNESSRTGASADGDLVKLLRDLSIRIGTLEGRYIGPRKQTGVTAVESVAQLPADPTPGDMALVLSTNTVYTANAAGWSVGGTLP